MQKLISSLLCGASCAVFPLSWACAQDFSACKDHFVEAQPPEITRSAMQNNTYPLCYQGFAVLYSGLSYTPLWSAEHLTAEHLDEGASLRRVNAFHPESAVPEEFRSQLRDYVSTGYDRGHLTPSGDEWSRESQQETFTLANMIPQNPDNNQNLWEGIEQSVRDMASEEGELYIVTGPAFTKNLRVGRLLVPTMIFKAVYAPSLHKAAAYMVANGPGRAWTQVPISYLVTISGINPFPGLSASETVNELALPWPRPHGTPHAISPGQVSPDNGGVPDLKRRHDSEVSSASSQASTEEAPPTHAEKDEKFGALLIITDLLRSEAKKMMLHMGATISDYIGKHYTRPSAPSHASENAE